MIKYVRYDNLKISQSTGFRIRRIHFYLSVISLLLIFFSTGCGILARSLMSHKIECYSGDGDISIWEYDKNIALLSGFGYKVYFPEFIPKTGYLRYYKLENIPKVDLPASIHLYIHLPKNAAVNSSEVHDYLKKTYQVMIALTDEETGDVVFEKQGLLSDFEKGVRNYDTVYVADFKFGEVNFDEISESKDYMLKMEFKLNRKRLKLPAYAVINCGESE